MDVFPQDCKAAPQTFRQPKISELSGNERQLILGVLLTLIINRLGHHVSINTEIQPLQGWLQLHAHTLKHLVIGSQRGQESGPH